MAIDPTGRFPQLPVPFGQPRTPATAQTPRDVTPDVTIENRGRPARAELQPDVQNAPDQGQANPQQQQQRQGVPTLSNIDPNAPRGSIIDIIV